MEARGLGGLVVLVRAAGIDVGLERQDLGPPQLVLFDPMNDEVDAASAALIESSPPA